jgi:hypothetical protein
LPKRAIFVRNGGATGVTGLTFSGNTASTGDANQFDTIGNLTISTATIASNQDASETVANSGSLRVILSNTVTITVLPGQDYTIGTTNTAYRTIADNNQAGVTIFPLNGNISESSGTASFTPVLNSQVR